MDRSVSEAMAQHLSPELIERYRERNRSARELLEVDDHLSACGDCRERIRSESELQTAVLSLRTQLSAAPPAEPGHLGYEELEAYVDGRLEDVDLEIVRSHLDLCPQCEVARQDLALLRAAVGKTPQSAPSSWIPLAATLALTLGAVLLATLFLQRALGGLRADVGALRQENQRLRQDYLVALSQVRDLETQIAELRSESTTRVVLEDAGGQILLDERGALTGLGPLPAREQELVTRALLTARVETPALIAQLIGEEGSLRGGGQGAPFALLSPVGTLVLDDRPTFRWQPLSGARDYTVSVYDAGLNAVVESTPLEASEWRSTRSLDRGGVYTWQVAAEREGKRLVSPAPPAPQARFKVAGREEVEALSRAERAAPRSHLLLGILYARAGALDEADRELQALAEANPRSAVARRLQQSVKVRSR